MYAINALYAGYRDNGWAQGLWPHKATLSPVFIADGVSSKDYQICNRGFKDRFHDGSIPNATWWSGLPSGMNIGLIGPVGATITFTLEPPYIEKLPSRASRPR
jgi:hypothetical protein